MRELTLEITNRCMENCIHCSSGANMQNFVFLCREKIFEIIRDSLKLGFERIYFSGGEPLLYPGIVDLVQYSSTQGLNTIIYTSGVSMNKYYNAVSISTNTFNRLKNAGVSSIIIGLQSLDMINQYTFCRTGNYKFKKESIDNALEVFEDSVEINFVPNRINIDEIYRLIDFSIDKGIRKINFLGLVPYGRADFHKNKLLISKEDHIELMNCLKTLYKQFPDIIRIGKPLTCGSCDNCGCGIDKLVITPEGKVHGCESLKNITITSDKGFNVIPDNIYNKSLVEIYNNSQYLKDERILLENYQTDYKTDVESMCPIQRKIWSDNY